MASATTPGSGYGSTVTWAGHDLGFITDISGLNIKTKTIPTTNNDSTDAHEEFVAGFVDGGEVSITCRFIGGDTTGQKYFRTDLQARSAARQVVITRPDLATKWTFNALPTGMSDPIPVDNVMDVTFTMKITGKPVFAYS